MQMIDVLKRLAELDSANPNVINESDNETSKEGLEWKGVGGRKVYGDDEGWGKDWKEKEKPSVPGLVPAIFINGKKWKTFKSKDEAERVAQSVSKKYPDKRVRVGDAYANLAVSESAQIDECGMMPAMEEPDRPATPASINMTAASGDELGSLIKAIATLAGTADHGHEEPLSAPATVAVAGDETPDMRSVIDKLNLGRDEEGEEDEEEPAESYDNTPADPTDTNEFDAEQHAHHENPPGAAKGRGLMTGPRAVPTMEEIEQSLFADYKKFIDEN